MGTPLEDVAVMVEAIREEHRTRESSDPKCEDPGEMLCGVESNLDDARMPENTDRRRSMVRLVAYGMLALDAEQKGRA